MGSTVLVRAAAQAWRQAIVSACPRLRHPARRGGDAARGVGLAVAAPRRLSRRAPAAPRFRAGRGGHASHADAAAPCADGTKAGMSAEGAAKAAAGAKSKLSLQEAQMILSVEPNAAWEDVLKARARHPPRRDGRMRCGRAHAWCSSRPNAPNAPQKYNHLMAANAQHGSFYLQSKARAATRPALPFPGCDVR